jgi:hypothetical protein
MRMKVMMTAAIMVGLGFASCRKIKGEGPVITEYRSVSSFSRIRSGMSGNVYVRQDSIYKVEIQAQRNILNVLNTTVSGGELKIDFDYNKHIGNYDRIDVYISCPNIESLSLSGSGNIAMTNKCSSSSIDLSISGSGNIRFPEMNTNRLNAKISGSGDIDVLGGWATTLSTQTTGSGDIDVVGLIADYADVRVSGSGDTKVNASEQLDVNISGSGDVYYRGNPKLHTSISGSGKVRRL